MGNSHILVIDDEKNIRMTVSRCLEALDVDADTAINAEDALERLQKRAYALVLLDLRLPGMDGMELLRKIRATWPATQVVVITAHGTVDSAVEAMRLGVSDYVQKPFTPEEIRRAVAHALGLNDPGDREGDVGAGSIARKAVNA